MIPWTEEIVLKASKRLYLLRVLKRAGVSTSHLVSIYVALIRSITEDVCPVWSTSLPHYLSNQLEMVQKRAMRIIHPLACYDEPLCKSSISRLADRRLEVCSKTFFKACAPDSRLHCFIAPRREEVHGRRLRSSGSISLPKCRTERFKRSFFPYMIFNEA